MEKRLVRVAPWQAGKVFAVIYFFLSFIFVIPIAIATALGAHPKGFPSAIMLVFLPFLYAVFGLLFVALAAWLYNVSAKFTGGLQVSVVDTTDA